MTIHAAQAPAARLQQSTVLLLLHLLLCDQQSEREREGEKE
jgi:hypothetical protein